MSGDEPASGAGGGGGPLASVGDWWNRRGLAVRLVLVAVVLLAAVAVGAGAWLTQPQELEPYQDPVSAEARVQNTVLYDSLRAAGINESLADVNDERIYVAYSLPGYAYDGSAVNESVAIELQRFVVGASADVAPDVDRLVIVQYDAGEPRLLWTVGMADFDAFVAGELTLEAFEGRIEVVTY